MRLQSKDIYVLIGTMRYEPGISEAKLAEKLSIAPSEVHYSWKRLVTSRLYTIKHRHARVSNVLEFSMHALKYVFPVRPGPPALGLPTEFACPTLGGFLTHERSAYGIPVWPHLEGTSYGYEIEPLHKNVPVIAQTDNVLYEIFALMDVLRQSSPRSAKIAYGQLEERLQAL